MDLSPTADTKTQVVSTYLDQPIFSCSQCCVVVALQDELISKSFSGREGRGLRVSLSSSLLHSAVNVKLGKREDRPLLTGVHTVADVFCVGCNDRLGWYYVKASDSSQKYKEGKFLLEREKIVKENRWKIDE
ncbi:yippee-domain-containing protein [Rickenella mellea]|uniref:Protein yippee-like n=1 Tax=Rickenella mellea TaxID=50990 RepID=A0A4Y7QGP1_9AGAM|nr:yippee-domain-containing protein [Rickenella mellea]